MDLIGPVSSNRLILSGREPKNPIHRLSPLEDTGKSVLKGKALTNTWINFCIGPSQLCWFQFWRGML